ncbi:hypothetical protein A3H16_01735 [Candidatus Kaiserbacteria bacterium RIFCSPLOWO2_12_FULL_53_8]|nr:MAG: hypothetical protein A3H16_01735 [Candidatus Kaiserbacteria bacterium RIFCSPLOWO2_12_FULL_53_8]
MAVKALKVFPRAARFDGETDSYERPIPGLPMLLIYTITDDLVEVIGVFHTSRNPKTKHRTGL